MSKYNTELIKMLAMMAERGDGYARMSKEWHSHAMEMKAAGKRCWKDEMHQADRWGDNAHCEEQSFEYALAAAALYDPELAEIHPRKAWKEIAKNTDSRYDTSATYITATISALDAARKGVA